MMVEPGIHASTIAVEHITIISALTFAEVRQRLEVLPQDAMQASA